MSMLAVIAILTFSTWIGMAFVLFKTKLLDDQDQ